MLLNEKRNEFLVNVMLILGIFFIHKSKCMKTKPYLKKDLICNFFPALECMKSKKAQKLTGIIRDLELLKEE